MLFKIGFLSVTLIDIFDVALVSFLFYKVYQFIRGSVAARMLIGLLIILLFSVVADLFNLSGISWLFSNLKTVWVIAFVIIFQPEFRRMLLYIGHNPVIQKLVKVHSPEYLEDIVGAAAELSRKNFGALIVLLRDTGLKTVVETGQNVQAKVSKPMLMSIFNPRSPLHDGAVVIEGDVILAAKCQLPLSQDPRVDPALGMRHRAALGLSEQTDTIVLAVSEETGTMSLAEDGRLIRGLTEEGLLKRLKEAYYPQVQRKSTLANLLRWNEPD